jgi:tetratricopeptide (TPR) repeat protein
VHFQGYVLRGELGRGGMGVVYRADDSAGNAVAIKVLQRIDPEARARFEREIRLTSGLGQAAGFVPTIAHGDSAQGPWLAMPLMPGGTLRDRLHRGPLGPEATVKLGCRLSRAIGEAHARGIVHRDLKPENVLFTAEGEPLVADLGLAKHFDLRAPGASQTVQVSTAGGLRGTVGYAAPEQFNDARRVGPRADVFSLGAILYESLAGRPAFAGDTLMAIVDSVLAGVEPLATVRPDTPPALARAIERALAADPEQRQLEAMELYRDLSAPDVLVVPPRRSRLGYVAAVLVALAVPVAGAGLYAAGTALQAAEEERVRAEEERARRVAAEAEERLRLEEAERRRVAEEQAREEAVRREAAAKELAAKEEAREAAARLAAAKRRGSDAARLYFHDSSRMDEARVMAESALEVDPDDAGALFVRGSCRFLVDGDPARAVADLSRAFALAKDLAPRDDWRSQAIHDCGRARAATGQHEAALVDFERAIKITPTFFNVYNSAGISARESGRLGAARAYFDKALSFEPEYVLALMNRGQLSLTEGDMQAALADSQRGIELLPRYRKWAWVSDRLYGTRGDARSRLGDVPGALADYKQALTFTKDGAVRLYFEKRIAELER